ncbi:CHAT domain-containing protein [Thiolinea disciformis]|uniref:CHAT domain-containing protein n=1 Tax=Thiolinea disciformis TaxID=125614 RepID=UPI00039DACC2|nr:CHAT domain-containing protein [Thiolinea disciformis]
MSKTILFLAANPSNRDALFINDEYLAVKAHLRNTEFQIVMQPALQFKDLLDALRTHKPWMVHFSGHGEGALGLLLEDAKGKAAYLKSDSLKTMFSLLHGHTHCVFLNACYSEQQAKQISPYIPYIIGMSTQVRDAISLHFSEQIYAGLAKHWGIEQAFYWAKTAVRQEHYLAANIPILYKQGQLIEQEPPSSSVSLALKQRSFVDAIFKKYLNLNSSLILLAQEGFQTQHYVQALRDKAKLHFGAEWVLNFSLPADQDMSESDYFSELATDCDLDQSVHSLPTWRKAMRARLKKGKELFLLVTRFEKGDEKHRRTLAGELRSLLEDFPKGLHLVLIGGERLAALKYEQGAMSLLNHLPTESVPELCIEDIYLLYPHTAKLAENLLQAILHFADHHPVLVEACLRELAQGESNWSESVKNSHIPAQLFNRVRQEKQLCDYLNKNQFGRHDTWATDPLERRLYWQNFLKPQNGCLVWRCEWLREMGKELLKC